MLANEIKATESENIWLGSGRKVYFTFSNKNSLTRHNFVPPRISRFVLYVLVQEYLFSRLNPWDTHFRSYSLLKYMQNVDKFATHLKINRFFDIDERREPKYSMTCLKSEQLQKTHKGLDHENCVWMIE